MKKKQKHKTVTGSSTMYICKTMDNMNSSLCHSVVSLVVFFQLSLWPLELCSIPHMSDYSSRWNMHVQLVLNLPRGDVWLAVMTMLLLPLKRVLELLYRSSANSSSDWEVLPSTTRVRLLKSSSQELQIFIFSYGTNPWRRNRLPEVTASSTPVPTSWLCF